MTRNDKEPRENRARDEPVADVISRVRRGDPSALADLLAAHVPEVEAFIRYSLPARLAVHESIRDLTQSLVSDLLPELSRVRFENRDAFRGWLRQCAMNKIRMRLRHWRAACRDGQRERPLHDLVDEPYRASGTSPSEAARRGERERALHDALQQLPDDQREVVVMVKLLGMPHADAARAMGKTQEACRKTLSRALRTLSGVLPDV